MNKRDFSRRQFMKSVAAAGAFSILPARLVHAAPSERIGVGIIGLGGRGMPLLRSFMSEPDVRIAALCDVHPLHYRDNPWGKGFKYGHEAAKDLIEREFKDANPHADLDLIHDYRELCARDDIDAVVVATPDHWHALCIMEALKHGKDVYCEKPVTHTFYEGVKICEGVKAAGAVFQVGSQQRSERPFRHGAELVRNGVLGKVNRVEVGLPAGYEDHMDDSTPSEIPDRLDYETWCGPAAKLPYCRALHHRWWRANRVYGGGNVMDWIGHHNDIAHWGLGLDNSGPKRVEAVDWAYIESDIYDTPRDFTIQCDYADGHETHISSANPIGVKWIGDEGWIYARRGAVEASDERWLADDFNAGDIKLYHSENHTRNFLDCMRSRKACVAPAETGHRSITPGHLAFVSQELGRALEWDPETQTVKNDEEAQNLLMHHDYRAPWSLPKEVS